MNTKIYNQRLGNGLKIIKLVNKNFQQSTCCFVFNVGYCHLSEEEFVNLHALEHLILDSSKLKGGERLFARKNGEINGLIEPDSTKLYFSASPDNFIENLKNFCDMLSNVNFSTEKIEEEKEILLEENAESENELSDYITQQTYSTIWPGSMIGAKVSQSTITNAISQDRMNEIYKRMFLCSNFVIMVFLKEDKPEVNQIIKTYFGNLEEGRQNDVFKRTKIAITQNLPCLSIIPFNQNKTDLIIDFAIEKNLLDKKFIRWHLLNSILFESNSTSVLSNDLRNNKKLVYDIDSNIVSYNYEALLTISTSFFPSKIQEVLTQILRPIKDYSDKDIVSDLLDHEKERYISGLESGCDDPWFWIYYCDQAVFHNYDLNKMISEDMRYVKSISASDITSFIEKSLDYKAVNINIVGRISKEEVVEISELIKILTKHEVYLTNETKSYVSGGYALWNRIKNIFQK